MSEPAPIGAGTISRRLWFSLFAGWVVLTLALTSIPNLESPVDVPGADKAAHLVFYGVMGFLCASWRRACGASPARAAFHAILFTAVFGALDEAHQHWIPGRSMDLFDWFADASGGGVGVLASSLAAGLVAVRTQAAQAATLRR